ncbi:MAG TPA: SDR family oxidoreductase [Candidatus Nanoarchaeia archaeon]|nr:SDR family oxidoreductase [Candidatus Nanoarchaeia archaeon]
MSLERKVAIIGAAGMLGHAMQSVFPEALLFDANPGDDACMAVLDIAKRGQVFNALDHLSKGDCVINVAAYTNVDGVELQSNIKVSYDRNVQGPIWLGQLISRKGIRVVHFSTAYVFDGHNAPYSEQDTINPVNQYGKHKFLGESPILNEGGIVLRTDMLYGPHGKKNVVDRIVGKAKTEGTVCGVVDQHGSPTFTRTLAGITKQLMELWEKESSIGGNIYHATSRNGCSGAELAQEIVRILGIGRVQETTWRDYGQGKKMARRPRDCRLNTAKLNALGIATPDWRSDLEDYVRNYLMNKESVVA